MENLLWLLIHCHHRWTGVEEEETCTGKRAGTDYIICTARGKQGANWDWVTATVPCLLCGHQVYALIVIQDRVQLCQASLWFLLLLHTFICDFENIFSYVQKSLQYYKNNPVAKPYWLHVLPTCFTSHCLCLFLLPLITTCSCQICVLHCGALETISAHARDSIAQK